MDTITIIQFAILVLLLVLSGFFSSMETALTTVNQIRIKTLVEEGNKKAHVVGKILANRSKMLNSILFGNNLVNISASSLATILAMKIWGDFAVSIVTGVLTLLVLVFGEITPKTWAMWNAEKISLRYGRIIYALMKVLTPFVALLDFLSRAVFALLGLDKNRQRMALTEKDLKTYLDVGHQDGAIEKEEKDMINNVFDFGDAKAKDIMIPRIDMQMIAQDASYEELQNAFKEQMFTRLPVYNKETEDIIGLVNVKDFFLADQKKEFHIRDILRAVYYTYEQKKTADLLTEMRSKAMNVAIVLNEYGACVGMITLEDLLEEIVGQIRDEYDEDETELLKSIGEGQYQAYGSMKLDDINDELNTVFISEDYDTIGGLMIEALDRLPEKGEEVTLENGAILKAQKIEHNRIETVQLTLPEPWIDETIYEDAPNGETEEIKYPAGEKENACYHMLEEEGISFDRVQHDPLATQKSISRVEDLLRFKFCQYLFFSNRQQSEYYLVLLQKGKKCQVTSIAAALGVSRLVAGKQKDMEEILGATPGSLSIFALQNDQKKRVKLVMDQSIINDPYFGCHPGCTTATIKISTRDLKEKVLPAMGVEPMMIRF